MGGIVVGLECLSCVGGGLSCLWLLIIHGGRSLSSMGGVLSSVWDGHPSVVGRGVIVVPGCCCLGVVCGCCVSFVGAGCCSWALGGCTLWVLGIVHGCWVVCRLWVVGIGASSQYFTVPPLFLSDSGHSSGIQWNGTRIRP